MSGGHDTNGVLHDAECKSCRAKDIVIQKALAFQKAAQVFRTTMITDILTGSFRLVDGDLVGKTVDNQAEALEELFKALNVYKKTHE